MVYGASVFHIKEPSSNEMSQRKET